MSRQTCVTGFGQLHVQYSLLKITLGGLKHVLCTFGIPRTDGSSLDLSGHGVIQCLGSRVCPSCKTSVSILYALISLDLDAGVLATCSTSAYRACNFIDLLIFLSCFPELLLAFGDLSLPVNMFRALLAFSILAFNAGAQRIDMNPPAFVEARQTTSGLASAVSTPVPTTPLDASKVSSQL